MSESRSNKNTTLDSWYYLGEQLSKDDKRQQMSDEERMQIQHQEFMKAIAPSFQLYKNSIIDINNKILERKKKKKKLKIYSDKGLRNNLESFARPKDQWSFFKFETPKQYEPKKENLKIESPISVFLQAVIDNDLQKVTELLNLNLELVSTEPPKDLVVTSTKTKRTFPAENALTMAVKLQLTQMIELLLSYYNKLNQTDAVKDARMTSLSNWSYYERANNKIVIPKDYLNSAHELIDLSTHAASYERQIIYQKKIGIKEKTIKKLELELSNIEFLLNSLIKKLLPNSATNIEDFDVNLFFLALTRIFKSKFDSNSNSIELKQLIFKYCAPGIHFTQTAFDPETAQIYCDGLKDIMAAIEKDEDFQTSKNAANYILKDGVHFYPEVHHTNRVSNPQYIYGIDGQCIPSENIGGFVAETYEYFEKLCLAKEQKFLEIMQPYSVANHSQEITVDEPKIRLMCSLF